jgi:hypothetical protein
VPGIPAAAGDTNRPAPCEHCRPRAARRDDRCRRSDHGCSYLPIEKPEDAEARGGRCNVKRRGAPRRREQAGRCVGGGGPELRCRRRRARMRTDRATARGTERRDCWSFWSLLRPAPSIQLWLTIRVHASRVPPTSGAHRVCRPPRRRTQQPSLRPGIGATHRQTETVPQLRFG